MSFISILLFLAVMLSITFGMCNGQRTQTIRVVVPVSLVGLFQIEGHALRVTGAAKYDGDTVTLVIQRGSRYLGLADQSPFTEWSKVHFVDEQGHPLKMVARTNDLPLNERGIIDFGIAGRAQLAWFAVGDRDELEAAIETRNRMLFGGETELP